LEVGSHGEEKEEELEIEDLKRARSFEFDYALAAERSSAAFALEERFVAVVTRRDCRLRRVTKDADRGHAR
jgi:hypothetical protein